MLARRDLSKLDPSIGDLSKLETLIEQFKHVEGGKEVIEKVLENGILDPKKPAGLATARGHLYELQTALKLEANKHTIEKFGFYSHDQKTVVF